MIAQQHSAPRVDVTSPFWKRYRDLVADQVLPYQWLVMDDKTEIKVPDDPAGNTFEQSKSHAVRNMRIAAGLEEGEHYGFPFQDTDLYKWLEAVGYCLNYRPDSDLRPTADRLVDLLAQAQEPDGYLDTAFQRGGRPQSRWRILQRSHELYSMGHCIEAAAAYYEATGNGTVLDIARKMADCIDHAFGPEDGKIHGVDGHPEIEIALPRLYELTGERRYLDLASYFIHERGRNPDFFREQNTRLTAEEEILPDMERFPPSYYQVDKPFTEQTTAEGHAVRATYLCAGAVHVARLTGDNELLQTVRRLWDDIVHRRMYITGQVGSTHIGEAFTYDYDLPNATMYGESCASVGMSFFARRMLENEPRGEYGDILEKELFNGAISGISLDGRHFYYVNPLEADPQASAHNPDRKHVLTHRAQWFGCACCPANIARLIASIDRYIYSVTSDSEDAVAPTIYSHQFIANNADFNDFLPGVKVEQHGDFPWKGHIEYLISNPCKKRWRFAVRLPSWSRDSYALRCDGAAVSVPERDGFLYFDITPSQHRLKISLDLDMSVKAMAASPRIREDTGKIAFMRGPVVFCAESVDNRHPLWRYHIPLHTVAAGVRSTFEADLLGGVETIAIPAVVQDDAPGGSPTYAPVSYEPPMRRTSMKLVPYYSWANRENGAMMVWLQRQ